MRDFNPNSESYPYAVAMVGNAWVIMHMPSMYVHSSIEMPMKVRARVVKRMNENQELATTAFTTIMFDAASAELATRREFTKTDFDMIMASITPR